MAASHEAFKRDEFYEQALLICGDDARLAKAYPDHFEMPTMQTVFATAEFLRSKSVIEEIKGDR